MIYQKNHITENTIFILDDFEAIEKGVSNFLNLINNLLISRKSHLLINPINNEIISKYELVEKSSTAVLLPIKYILFTNQ